MHIRAGSEDGKGLTISTLTAEAMTRVIVMTAKKSRAVVCVTIVALPSCERVTAGTVGG